MLIKYDSDADGVVDTTFSNVIDFPVITSRLNEVGICTFSVIDRLGTLYATFQPLDFIIMEVQDDSSNVIFRGYITDKIFKHNKVMFTCHGFGIRLEWSNFYHNYIWCEGLIKTVPKAGDNDSIDLKQDDDDNGNPDWAWAEDYWINDKKVGLLVVDSSAPYDTDYWYISDIDDDATCAAEGNEANANVQAPNDGLSWWVQDTMVAPFDGHGYSRYELSGDAVIDGAKFIERIRLHYHIICKLRWTAAGSGGPFSTNWYLEIQDVDNDWNVLKSGVMSSSWADNTFKEYEFGQGEDVDGELVDDLILTGDQTYFNDLIHLDVADDYEKLHLRFRIDIGGGVGDRDCYIYSDFMSASIDYGSYDFSPVMLEITDSWTTSVETSGVVNGDWLETGVSADDSFKIGENTETIIGDIAIDSGVGITSITTLTKFIARAYKGANCRDVLEDVCALEGLEWWEDYANGVIKIGAEASFTDSTIDLTNANIFFDWEVNDTPNSVRRVYVYGNPSLNIYASSDDADGDADSLIDKIIIDDNLCTYPDAKEIADEEIAKLSSKRPSIKVDIQGVNSAAVLGTTVDLDMDPPDIDDTFAIRKIERKKEGYVGSDDIWTTLYLGLGHSPPDEKISGAIKLALKETRKVQRNAQINSPLSSRASIQWGDVAGTTTGVEAVITANVANGEIIDNAIDALIATHHDAGSGDHDDRYFTEAEHLNVSAGAGDAGKPVKLDADGNIDATMINDADIDHANIANVLTDQHHVKYTDAEAVAAVAAADDYIKNDANDVMNGDLTVNNLITAGNVDGRDISADINQAVKTTDSPTFVAVTVNTEAYDADGWNNDMTVPTKDAVRDVVVVLTDATIYQGTHDPSTHFFPNKSDDGADGVSGAGTKTFTAALGGFTNASAGDILLIEEGNDEGYYIIDTITNDTTLAVTAAGNFVGDAALQYQIFDVPTMGDYYIASDDGRIYDLWIELGDWLIWNETNLQWDWLRNRTGDNRLYVSTDDDIQVAIDEIEAVGAGIIILEAGTHTLDATLEINNAAVDIIIRGQGHSSVIDCNGDRTAIKVTSCETCVLENFEIDANDLTTAGEEIIELNDRAEIDRLYITGDGTNGYGIEANVNNVRITNCIIDNVNYGINIANSNVYVTDCDISSCSRGINMTSDGDSARILNNALRANVIGLYFDGNNWSQTTSNYFYGNTSFPIFAANCHHGMIVGNSFESNDTNNAGDTACIKLDQGSKYWIISNNEFMNNNNIGAGDNYVLIYETINETDNLMGPYKNINNDALISDAGSDNSIVSENATLHSLTFVDGGSTVDIIRDEDNMASNDDNALATQQSIKAYVDSLTFDDDTIYPSDMVGWNGFTDNPVYGACKIVAMSDTSADVVASFYVKTGGTFKLTMIARQSAANGGCTVGAVLYVANYYYGENATSWNIVNGSAFDVVLSASAGRIHIVEYGSNITLDNDSHCGIDYRKDDNAGGASGNWEIYGFVLWRQ